MSIQVGVFNWELFSTGEGYYPAGLPAEWKLLYFANEFNSACINLSSAQVDYEQLNEMLEDLPASFELSIALSGLAQLQEWMKFLPPDPIKCCFLVLPGSEPLQELQLYFTSNGLARTGITETEQLVTQSAFWTPDLPSTPSNIALLPVQKEMKRYREWIQQWSESHAQGNSTLWLEGNTADYATLGRLRSLIELMGY